MVDLTLREDKGEPLTSAELDANWTALKVAVEALQAAGFIAPSVASDPESPVNGQVWYNSTGDRLKARIMGVTQPLGLSEIPAMQPAAGRYYRTDAGIGTTTTTLAGAANRIEIYPWTSPFDFDVDLIGCNVTTAVAASTVKLVLYDSDELGRPANLLYETAALDCATTGAKTEAVALSLLKGKQYWVGVRWNSTTTISAFQPYTCRGLDNLSIETAKRSKFQTTATYANGAPDPWVFNAAQAATGNPPALWFRVA